MAAQPGSPTDGAIIGIDLGTTNSLVAHTAPGHPPRVLGAIVPSVVRFEEAGGAVVGERARREAHEHPRTTIASAKRLMGRSRADVGDEADLLSYEVVEGEHETARIAMPGGRVITPQEVAAHVLRALREQAERELGGSAQRAVVTVPAYFDDAQRQATRDAGRLAGIDVVRIINEPTAAALAFGLGVGARADAQPSTVAVFDLGGGTFDISILRVIPAQPEAKPDAERAGADLFQVLSTSGDTRLGGDDFDNALLAMFAREINERFASEGRRIDIPPEALRALRALAEQTKMRLSTEDDAQLRVDLGTGADGVARVYERTVTRAEFEALIAPMIDRAVGACRAAMRAARKRGAPDQPDAVVLVGGSTRVPAVRAAAESFFGRDAYSGVDPDRVVALGAAVQASILAGDTDSALLLDVVPLSLGVETAGGAVAKLIVAGAGVPARASERFSTSVDGQTSIKIHILQGEREMAGDCRSLGLFHLSGIPPMPAGLPKLVVEFAVDASGVLRVSAVEERSGKRATLDVAPNHGLTRDAIERIEAESFAHAKEDMARHRVVDLIENAKLDLHWTNRQLERHADGLTDAEASELNAAIGALTSMVDSAQDNWRSVDANEFAAAKDRLDKASVRLHEVSIARSLKDEDAT